MEGDCTETRNQRGASQLFKVYKVCGAGCHLMDDIRCRRSVSVPSMLHMVRARCALRSRVASKLNR